MRLAIAALLTACATSVAAQERQQFDLVCEGTVTRIEEGTSNRVNTWNTRLSVDMESRRFCWANAGCPIVYTFSSANHEFLVLTSDNGDNGAQTINRRTGVLEGMQASGDVMRLQKAVCRIAPFSGFGERLF